MISGSVPQLMSRRWIDRTCVHCACDRHISNPLFSIMLIADCFAANVCILSNHKDKGPVASDDFALQVIRFSSGALMSSS